MCIHNEYVACDSQVLTPLKRYTMWRIPEAFDREVIRQVVHSFYALKEYPTIEAVLIAKSKEECGFAGG